jgi:peptidoglycan hydrolase CwlO-like protein
MKKISIERALKLYMLVSIIAIGLLVWGLFNTNSHLDKVERSINNNVNNSADDIKQNSNNFGLYQSISNKIDELQSSVQDLQTSVRDLQH